MTLEEVTPNERVLETPEVLDSRFGEETLPPPSRDKEGVPTEIQSRILGTFTGWQSDTVFELENGQVWKCQSCRSVYIKRQDPQITIERNFMGTYWLGLEGLNSKARVKRLR